MINSLRIRSNERRNHFAAADLMQQLEHRPTVILSTGRQQWEGSVLEAVGHDLRIASEAALSVGQQVDVHYAELPSAAHCNSQPVSGILHWASPRKTKEYGIALQTPLSHDAVQSNPGCYRESLRFDCRVAGTLICRYESECTNIMAVCVNYSREGVCFEVRSMPTIGAQVEFRFTSGMMPQVLNGHIRWVIGQNGTFLAGCELSHGSGYAISGVKV